MYNICPKYQQSAAPEDGRAGCRRLHLRCQEFCREGRLGARIAMPDSPHFTQGKLYQGVSGVVTGLAWPAGGTRYIGGVRLIRHEKGHNCGTRARSRLSFRSQPQDLGRIAGLPEGRGGSAFRKAGTSQAGPRQREKNGMRHAGISIVNSAPSGVLCTESVPRMFFSTIILDMYSPIPVPCDRNLVVK